MLFTKYETVDLLTIHQIVKLQNHHKIEKVDKAFYHYVRREDSSVTGRMSDKFYDLYPVMQELKELYDGKLSKNI